DSNRQRLQRIRNRTPRPLNHDQVARTEDLGIAMPHTDLEKGVAADDEEQLVSGALCAKKSDGIDGIRLALPLSFDIGQLEGGMAGNGQPDHRTAPGKRYRAGQWFMGRI